MACLVAAPWLFSFFPRESVDLFALFENLRKVTKFSRKCQMKSCLESPRIERYFSAENVGSARGGGVRPYEMKLIIFSTCSVEGSSNPYTVEEYREWKVCDSTKRAESPTHRKAEKTEWMVREGGHKR